MKVDLPKGEYVLAVSGGVDSMVLLDLLSRQTGISLVVAHFNHGIREDAVNDEQLVSSVAKRHGLELVVGRAQLGPDASEDQARKARYDFLSKVVKQHAADKLVTAHHQDDWIETALINLIRGTGRQGLSALASNPKIVRPLISTPKQAVVAYAQSNRLEWNEDSTNANEDYLRNYLRLSVLSKLSAESRQKIIKILDKVAETNAQIDNEFATLSHINLIDRQEFAGLPNDVSKEYIAYLLRLIGVKDYDSYTIERLSMAIKTARPNTIQPVKGSIKLRIDSRQAIFVTP